MARITPRNAIAVALMRTYSGSASWNARSTRRISSAFPGHSVLRVEEITIDGGHRASIRIV